ncbi:MAG TPA: L-seryl-tRNA(Sec) selenium transferase [Solirubrobacteraceae bacterium]|nr:L-seryl-tRNA(Sec) selenium transferase [Solirubrobacteraceae bacterium]
MGERGDTAAAALRDLPAVHELAAQLEAPHPVAVRAAREAIDQARAALLAGQQGTDAAQLARALVARLSAPSLRRVINATGVIVHTNLGRAPLARAARDAVNDAAHGYGNLELDLESGERGSRHDHVAALLCELTGAESAFAVNNGAGAVLLAAAALAGPGRAIVISRGQLVEIGGGFRIPEVIAQSGARMIEVGTTNRTRLADYERALRVAGEEVGAILRVHQSNFRSLGFVAEVGIEELCELGVPVIDDIGSGALADPGALPALLEEPPLERSVTAGAALVCCSGDKLLGGPQAGLILGRREAVAAAQRHPLARALRLDKLSLAALEATLRLYRDPQAAIREIPVLAMLSADEATLAGRAQRLASAIGREHVEVIRATGKVGGGALPLLELEGPAVAVHGRPDQLAAALRAGDPPVIARVHEGRLVLDPRTLTDDEVEVVAPVVRAALA